MVHCASNGYHFPNSWRAYQAHRAYLNPPWQQQHFNRMAYLYNLDDIMTSDIIHRGVTASPGLPEHHLMSVNSVGIPRLERPRSRTTSHQQSAHQLVKTSNSTETSISIDFIGCRSFIGMLTILTIDSIGLLIKCILSDFTEGNPVSVGVF